MSIRRSYEMAFTCAFNARKRVFLKRLQFTLRIYFRHFSTLESIEHFFSQTPLRRLLIEKPDFKGSIYIQQVRQFFYRSSISSHRKHFLLSHFTFLENSHTEDAIKQFYADSFQPILIFEEEDKLSFSISYQTLVSREGLLMLTIDMNNIPLYKIYFWFTEHNGLPTLCIGALQGGKNALEVNRDFTKKFWGLRPQNMAISLLRWYATTLGISQIYTFPKERLWNKKISEQTSLDEFWQEQGAIPVPETPFIKLELDIPSKDISDIPVRKRSMYKKRYSFLEQLRDTFVTQLNPLLKQS